MPTFVACDGDGKQKYVTCYDGPDLRHERELGYESRVSPQGIHKFGLTRTAEGRLDDDGYMLGVVLSFGSYEDFTVHFLYQPRSINPFGKGLGNQSVGKAAPILEERGSVTDALQFTATTKTSAYPAIKQRVKRS